MYANLLLLLAAAIWGMGFVAQRLGMEHLEPFAFNGIRFLVGAVSLLPLIWLMKKRQQAQLSHASADANSKVSSNAHSDMPSDISSGANTSESDKAALVKGGLIVGFVLFIAASFQQVGLLYTTAANAGFITGLYIVIVPILGLLLKHKTGLNTWLGCAIAAIGLFFLSIKDDMSIGYGDALQLIGALFWATHILVVDHYAKKVAPVVLACCQFVACGLLSLGVSFIIESPTLEAAIAASGSILYAGLVSVGVGYTLQVMAQQKAHPAHVAIILSLETVFAAIGGILFLDESLSLRALFGCGLMLLGMLISQVPLRYLVKSKGQSVQASQ